MFGYYKETIDSKTLCKIFAVSAVIILLHVYIIPIYSIELLDEWKTFSEENKDRLTSWAKCILQTKFKTDGCEKPEMNVPGFYGQFGVFITLVGTSGNVRGCFGSFDHKTDDLELIVREYLRGASREDPRYTPVSSSEIDALKIWITISEKPVLAKKNEVFDFKTTGFYLLNENLIGIVYVPSEIKDFNSFKKVLLKNRIKEVYTFKAIVIKEN